MSKARDLRTSSENNINMFDLLSMFGYEKKSKYTDLLLRLMKKSKHFKEHVNEIKKTLTTAYPFIADEDLDAIPDLTIVYFNQLLLNLFNATDLNSFYKFSEYNERGLIKQNDISRYNSFEELHNAMSIAEMVAQEKEMEKQIKMVYSDDTWLVVRPLTFESSKKYGSNTKWCTTQENNPEYYHKYNKKGVLIYVINKVSGYKVASFNSLDKNDPEFSWWNQKDTRIDSLQAEITNEIRDIVYKESTVEAKTNEFIATKLIDKNGSSSKKTNRVAKAIERVSNDEIENVSTQAEQPSYERMSLLSQEPQEMSEPQMEERREEAFYENRENIMDVETPRSQSFYTSQNR